MPAINIRRGVWEDLVAVADKQRRKPETLANQALQEFLRRVSDDELLSRSAAVARRSTLLTGDVEESIRRFRRKK